MTETANLGLPLLSAEQAQKHVTHNEALLLADGLTQLVLQGRGEETPPAEPVEGQAFALGEDPEGDWAGHDGEIAIWTSGGWRYATPKTGWRAWDISQGEALILLDNNWQNLSEQFETLQNLALLGVNTTADATNKLSVRSNAALFAALGAGDGGTGDMRLVLNREAQADTASLIYQSNWSGRAEMGLAGASDDFVIKTSANGSDFAIGLSVGAGTGFVTLNALFGSAVSFPTIAAGVLSVETSYVVPAPESGTSDTIDTISGGFDGAMLVITGTAGVTLTFADGTGNLKLSGNRVLDNFEDSLLLVKRGTDWIELSFANNG